MSKNSETNISGVYVDILCSYINFCGKKIYYVACIKRQKNILYVVVLEHQKLSFLHEIQKIFFFSQKLLCDHTMPRYTCKI
jgi:hypothetical protein